MILFETERLIVKRFTHSDNELFFRINGDSRVVHFIRPVKSREESDAFMAENINFYQDHSVLGRFAVFTKSNEFIGTFSYLYLSGEADFHLGYALVPDAWNKGYASELVKHGIVYFFAHTTKPAIYAILTAANTASQKVLTKNGFQFMGQSEEHGQLLDTYYINRNFGSDPDIQVL